MTEDIIFYDMNFHTTVQTVLYGNGTTMIAPAIAGSTLDFRNGNLKDVFFQNAVGGVVGTVTVAGTIVSKKVSDVLRGA